MLTFIPLTEFDFHHQLARSEGVALVLFGAPACAACRSVEKRLPGAVAGLVSEIYKVDVQASTGLARAYEIFHLPALFLFVDGRYHAPIASEISAAKLKQALEQALAAPPQEEP